WFLTGAAVDAGAAMGGAGAAGADKMSDAMARSVSAMQNTLKAALAFRQMIVSSLTGFVDPVGAWDATVQRVNASSGGGGGGGGGGSRGKDPAVKAAEKALKEGRRRA